MHDYSRPLGDAVKRARGKLNLTQNEVADLADVDVRTVLNIENYKGNPFFSTNIAFSSIFKYTLNFKFLSLIIFILSFYAGD